MSIDHTLNQLNVLIESFHTTVDRVHSSLGSLTSRINRTLEIFDRQLVKITDNTNGLSSALEGRVSQLPDNWIYMAIGAGVLVILALLIAVLALKTTSMCRDACGRQKKKLLSDPPLSSADIITGRNGNSSGTKTEVVNMTVV